VKKKKISLGIVKHLERMYMKWNKIKLKKNKQKQNKIFNDLYNIFYINKISTHVHFFDFERVISRYEKSTTVWSNHIWRSYFPFWKSSNIIRGITKYLSQKMENSGKKEAFNFVLNIYRCLDVCIIYFISCNSMLNFS
jgi:hypothetical protein